MLTTTENALERLVALVGEHSDLNGAQVLDLWAEELTQERQKQEARRTALADEALYYVARVEEVPVYFEAIGEAMPRDVKVEKMTKMKKAMAKRAASRASSSQPVVTKEYR